MSKVIDEAQLLSLVLDKAPADQCTIVAISGIKCSGKTEIALDLVDQLQAMEINTLHICADRWMNPDIEFSEEEAGQVFYDNSIRFDELFDMLIAPLKRTGTAELSVELLMETTNEPYLHTYSSRGVRVVVLDGIFLFKRHLMSKVDMKIWVECPFETAKTRAVLTGKEGLPEDETQYLYETVYEPAMRLHMQKDEPVSCADLIIDNSN